MKKIIYGIIAAYMVCCSSVNAAETEAVNKYFNEAGAVGLTFDVKTELPVTLMVFKGNSTWDESSWKAGNSDDIMYVFSNIASDDKVSYRMILSQNGKYNALLKNEDIELEYPFMYSERSVADDASEQIKLAAKNDEDILGLVDTLYDTLLVSTDLYSTGSTTAAQLVKDYIKENEIDSVEKMSALIEKSYLLAAVNSGNASVGDYMYSAGIYGTGLEKYAKGTGDNLKQILNSLRVSNSLSDFEKNINEAVVLATIGYSANPQLINDALSEFYIEIGINKTDVTAALCSYLNKKVFNSYTELKTAVETFKNSGDNNPGAGGTPSGGASSANGSGIAVLQPPADVVKADIFKDIDDVKWAKEAIEALYYAGVVSGKNNEMFCPHDSVLREEFTKMIIDLLDLNVVGDELRFNDTDSTKWYYPYIKSAYNAGIVSGQSEEFFGVGQKIMRQDLAVIVCNALDKCGIVPVKIQEEEAFKDSADIADYAITSVNRLQTAGIVAGYDGFFNPRGNATRAEAARIIYVVMNLLD